jgi:hypothetical protein
MTQQVLRSRLPIALLLLGAVSVAGCGASTPTTACEKWCGSGSARVTFAGQNDTIYGGGCVDAGAAGIDARFGDWQNGAGSYLTLAAYRPGSPTPTPGPTPAPSAAPTGPASPLVDGSIAGQPFILGPGAIITMTPDGTGTFAGPDVNGGGEATGTFNCH